MIKVFGLKNSDSGRNSEEPQSGLAASKKKLGGAQNSEAAARSSPEDRLGFDDGGDDLGHAKDDAGASLCPRAPMPAHMLTPTGFSRWWQER